MAGRPVPRPGEVRLREVSRGPWHCALQPETSRLICRIFARRLISTGRQQMPIAASRCYLIQMLRSALTCTSGCSCWSPDEENSPRVFPYHGSAAKRRARSRLRSSYDTVDGAVMGPLYERRGTGRPASCRPWAGAQASAVREQGPGQSGRAPLFCFDRLSQALNVHGVCKRWRVEQYDIA